MIELEKFRKLYPELARYDDDFIKLIEEQAECFINTCSCNEQMKMLLVAHMLKIRMNSESGNGVGSLTGATIDKVSVSFSVPTSSSDQQGWFNLTPYGQQFSVLIKRCSSGGRYVGGRAELSAFRRVGGRFSRGS